jgi:hypothetical protein
MTTQSKSSPEKNTNKNDDAINAGVELFTSGVHTLVQVQQAAIDFAARQHAEAMSSTRAMLDRYEQVSARTTATMRDAVTAQTERTEQALNKMVGLVR